MGQGQTLKGRRDELENVRVKIWIRKSINKIET